MKKLSHIMKRAHLLAKTYEGAYVARLALGLQVAHKEYKRAAISLKSADYSKLDPTFHSKNRLFSGIHVQISGDTYREIQSQQELNSVIGIFVSLFVDGDLFLVAGRKNKYMFVSNTFETWISNHHPKHTFLQAYNM